MYQNDLNFYYENLGNSLGYFSNMYRTFIIHINEAISYEKQLFTIAHELGHVILHPDLNTAFLKENTYYSTDKSECEANEFATELLFHQGGGPCITVNEALEAYGIPNRQLYKNF